MLMVALLADSGFFDWAAVKMYELSKGRIWVLITLLNVGTAIMSAFLVGTTTQPLLFHLNYMILTTLLHYWV